MAAATGQLPVITGFAQLDRSGVLSNNKDPPRWTVGMPVTVASVVYLAVLIRYAAESWFVRNRCLGSCFFPLEAALAVLAVATGIDITARASNLSVVDHLAKLSSIHLTCVTMHLSLSTIGIIENTPLVLIIASLAVSLFNMLASAVTYGWSKSTDNVFALDYRFSSIITVLVFSMLVSHSLTTTVVRGCMRYDFAKKNKKIFKIYNYRDCKHERCECFSRTNLETNIKRYWVMAVTSNPDRALCSSGMPLASAVLCWVNVVALLWRFFSVMLRCPSCRNDWGRHFSSFWNSIPAVVFLLQYAAVFVGLAASRARGLNSNPFAWAGAYESLKKSWHALFYFRTYRLARLMSWKKDPFLLRRAPQELSIGRVPYIIMSWLLKRVHVFSVNVLIYLQLGVILLTNTVLMIALAVERSIFKMCKVDNNGLAQFDAWQAIPVHFSRHLKWREGGRKDKDIERYVLSFSGSDENYAPLGRWIDFPGQWIRRGARGKPNQLNKLLGACSRNFQKARDMDENLRKPFLKRKGFRTYGDLEKPPVCKTLVIVILTGLFYEKFLGTHRTKLLPLLQEVEEGIRYTRIVEQYPKKEGEAIPYGQVKTGEPKYSCINEAHRLWDRLMTAAVVNERGFNTKTWLQSNENLDCLFNLLVVEPERLQSKLPDVESVMQEVNERLDLSRPSESSRRHLTFRWVAGLAYASRMYYYNRQPPSKIEFTDKEFEECRKLLADLIGDCLMDLPFAIINTCAQASFGGREEKVRQAAIMLGELEDILKTLYSIHLGTP